MEVLGFLLRLIPIACMGAVFVIFIPAVGFVVVGYYFFQFLRRKL